jgi:hypothetical protein
LSTETPYVKRDRRTLTIVGSSPNRTAPFNIVNETSWGIITLSIDEKARRISCWSIGDSAKPPTRKRYWIPSIKKQKILFYFNWNISFFYLPLTSGLFNTSPIVALIFSTVW